jgi:hypothetical protein
LETKFYQVFIVSTNIIQKRWIYWAQLNRRLCTFQPKDGDRGCLQKVIFNFCI